MSTTKKHLIAGAVIGGLLLAATMQPGTTFALSETSSSTTDTSTAKPLQPVLPATPDGSGDTQQPTNGSGGTDAIATGSVASQSSDGTISSSSTTTTNADQQPMQPLLPSAPSNPTDPTSPQNPNDASSSTATQINNTDVTNTVDGTAKTGDAKVKDGTVGGNATTGNAGDTATLINTVASSSNLSSGSLQTFTYNINGTHNGDILINPSNLLTANSSNDTTPNPCPTPTTDTAVNNTTINNLVNLLATSGNATVSNNAVGGNATSGDATTEADIINLIEALISDKQSFLGVVNVNGNLNGNLLLPAGVIDSLLTPTQGTAAGNTTATNNINVNNQVNLTAASGTAAVTGNGVGGNATSGDATTILNTCNLINSNIVGGNVLLVFVNVMGNWYGLLLNAPAGTTNAALGGGISQDVSVPASQLTAINNETINNTVNLTSITGNATVMNNGIGGNATTGHASVVADIVNILGSQINLSGWLGVLVINVYGTWNGNLAIQTAPTTPTHTSGGPNSHHNHHTNGTDSSSASSGNGYAYYIAYPSDGVGQTDPFTLTSAHILGASTSGHDLQNAISEAKHMASTTDRGKQASKNLLMDFLLAGIGGALAVAGGATRFFTNRRKKI
jgi:hypothetical protein